MTAAAPASSSRFAALSTPAFRRYWLGSMASIGSTQLLFVGMGWLVFRLTGSPFDLGLLGVALAVPTILVSVLGGVLADTWERRRLLTLTNAAIAVLLGALAALDRTGLIEVWHVLAVAVLYGVVSGFDWPARQAIFASLVPSSQLASAVALTSLLWQGSRLVMPAAGGLIIAAGGTPAVFALGALGYASMCVVLATLPRLPGAAREGDALTELLAGARYILASPTFYTLIGLTYVLTFFGISYMQIMPVLADGLGAGSEGFGTMVSASGVGSLTGTIIIMSRRLSVERAGALFAPVVGSACGFLVFGVICWHAGAIPHAFYLALVCMAITHAFASVFFVLSMTVLQQEVPDRLRGRVMGLHGVGFTLIMLGGVFSGTVAELVHPPAAVVLGGVVILAAVAIGSRTLRR